jgi:hypothetical protein
MATGPAADSFTSGVGGCSSRPACKERRAGCKDWGDPALAAPGEGATSR